MKLIRYEYQGIIRQGKLVDHQVYPVDPSPTFPLPVEEVRLLLPIEPTKIIAVGLNYASHARELGLVNPKPSEPVIFIKPNTTLLKNEGTILLPKQSVHVEYEGELGVVISQRCRHVKKENAKDVILGYIVVNDVTARDLQPKQGQWTACKSFDTFLPVGSWIETELDLSHATITTRVNHVIRQIESVSSMIFSVEELIEYISSIMTLMPGDVIITGTPPGVGKLMAGDTVEVSINGLGTVISTVENEI